ncbi:helix-turn-helix domain-containing protein [Actinomycetospora soli]|uniref:helix-turn-helix domain-containing protein n=1 Tax=Actinomycetospora soli TaxID=2893887 RepID=UPI001E64D35F|nr:helix-turn-helix transcriptional regulator [Actinomycetospora soli]MCD2185951.1 helix-turn-helix transcriptional regulator [Actinomycetospora soli]
MGELIRLDAHRRGRAARPAAVGTNDSSVHVEATNDAFVPSGRGPQRAARGPEPLWREVVGRRVRAVRRERGERLADVAERAGISPQYLSEIERGVKDPSSEILAAVAGALDLPLRDLVGLAHTDLARGAGSRGPVLLAA